MQHMDFQGSLTSNIDYRIILELWTLAFSRKKPQTLVYFERK